VRLTSQHAIDWATHDGWYINLQYNSQLGEQVISAPILRDGKIFLSTHVPGGDECDPNQNGWFMIFDARSGSMQDASQIDLNGDGEKNDGAFAGVSGLVNPHAAPTIIAAASADILLSQTPTEPELLSATLFNDFIEGRLTWRELEP